jgi:hypothetical protein
MCVVNYEWFLAQNIKFEANTTYTVSALIKCTGEGRVFRCVGSDSIFDANLSIPKSSVIKRYNITFTTRATVNPNGNDVFFQSTGTVDGQFLIGDIKIEKGSVTTDWSPAWEDSGFTDPDGWRSNPTPIYIPNKPNGTPAYTLVDGDTEIKASAFLNNTPFMVDMKKDNLATIPSVAIFDKSNTAIWKDAVRTGVYYDSTNPFNWHYSELNQAFLYENIQDAHKYKIWNRINQRSLQWKDFFIYDTALTGADICKAKDYVGVGENYESVDGDTYICKIDNLI